MCGRRRNEREGEEQGGERAVVRGEEEEAGMGGRLARGRRSATACVAGKDRGSRAGKREEEEEEERKGVGVHACLSRVLPLFPFFLIHFYHKTSTYCITNRIPEPVIINRIPKHNRLLAYLPFDYIKDRFSKLHNCYWDSTI